MYIGGGCAGSLHPAYVQSVWLCNLNNIFFIIWLKIPKVSVALFFLLKVRLQFVRRSMRGRKETETFEQLPSQQNPVTPQPLAAAPGISIFLSEMNGNLALLAFGVLHPSGTSSLQISCLLRHLCCPQWHHVPPKCMGPSSPHVASPEEALIQRLWYPSSQKAAAGYLQTIWFLSINKCRHSVLLATEPWRVLAVFSVSFWGRPRWGCVPLCPPHGSGCLPAADTTSNGRASVQEATRVIPRGTAPWDYMGREKYIRLMPGA